MRAIVVALLIAVAIVVPGCKPEQSEATRAAEPEQEETQEKKSGGFAGNVGGLRQGSESGFAAASENMP